MRRLLASAVVLTLVACGERPGEQRAASAPPRYDFGRAASPQEIAAWDIDVRPDGAGLPAGSGTARLGAPIYARKCAICHGADGTHGPTWPLVGREPRDFSFANDPKAVPTIGNYWPYATTLYDYLNRAMPYNAPGSLSHDEVYALVAFLLWKNEIVGDTTVLNARTLPAVVMPARDRFVPDNRKGGPEVR